MKLTLMSVASLTLAASGLMAAAPPREVQLKVTYRDAMGTLSDGVTSDGLVSFTGIGAQYVHGSDDNVLAILQDTGNFRFSTRLDTRKPLRRRLCLNFGTQPITFPAPGCTDVLTGMHGDGRIQEMAYGEVLAKRVRLTWNANGYDYHLGYGTDWNFDGTYDTVPVSVSCASATQSSTSCDGWVMSTTGRASLSREQVLKGGKHGPTEFLGYYDMNFEVAFAPN